MQLLASVRYFLFSSLPQDRQDDLRQVLDSNGATPAATLKDATHIMTNAYRFEGLGEVDGGVHVVTVRVACFWKEGALSDLFIGPIGRLSWGKSNSESLRFLLTSVVSCVV